ncbi:MAG: DUF5615 family PIN-like protein [Planctomycetota bacterium]
MKLLLDENLSHRLLAAIQSDFPDSVHVRDVGLEHADDATIWAFAREHRYTILSKDADFHQRSFLYGQPPKVVWLRVGNFTTEQVLAILRRHLDDLRQFDQNQEAAFLVVS